MKFEELFVLIDKMNGEAGNATSGNVDSLVYSGLDVHLMLEEIKSGIEHLQETYAPKIKMTGKELDFLNSRFKTNDSSGSKVFIDANGRKIEISPRNLQAWLHPELIEVSDE